MNVDCRSFDSWLFVCCRAECSLEKLRALNDYVKIYTCKEPLSDCSAEYFQKFTVTINAYERFLQTTQELFFQCVVLTEGNLDEMKRINEICRTNNIVVCCSYSRLSDEIMFSVDQFITADIYGVFSRCFVDCGAEPFTVFDKDGEQLKEVLINHISPVRTNKGERF